MKTIGAKELRLHLDQILDRVLGGEEIIVSHRFKGPVRLSPVYGNVSGSKPKKLAGLHAFDEAPKHISTLDPSKSLKDLYSESVTKKHGR